jgi:hypothetical protein
VTKMHGDHINRGHAAATPMHPTVHRVASDRFAA